MLATRTSTGSGVAVTHSAWRLSVRSMRRITIACSSRSFSERSSCSPRWSSTAGSALRRVEPASASVLTRWPSRRTSSSGLAAISALSPRPTQKTKQEGNSSRSTPKTAAGSYGRGARAPAPRARARSSPARRPRISSTARATARLVVLGRHRARDPVAPGGRGVEQRQRARAQLPQAPLQAGQQLLGRVVGRGERGEGQAHTTLPHVLVTGQRHLWHDQRGRLEAAPRAARRRRPGRTRSRPRRSAHPTRRAPSRAGSPGGSQTAAAASARQRSATVAKRSGPRADRLVTSPSAASAARPRSGCSNTNHGSPGRREAHTTALGSTSGSQRRVSVASVGARCAARAARRAAGAPRAGRDRTRRARTGARAIRAKLGCR